MFRCWRSRENRLIPQECDETKGLDQVLPFSLRQRDRQMPEPIGPLIGRRTTCDQAARITAGDLLKK